MKEISLHLLDLIENSASAGASQLTIEIDEDPAADRLRLTVADNGAGMPPAIASTATDAFTTTRTTRSVGMGLALLSGAAELAGGRVEVRSRPEEGTTITAEFQLSHLDRAPLGRLEDTLAATALLHPDLALHFIHRGPGGSYQLDLLSLASGRTPAQLRAEITRLVHAGLAHLHSTA